MVDLSILLVLVLILCIVLALGKNVVVNNKINFPTENLSVETNHVIDDDEQEDISEV